LVFHSSTIAMMHGPINIRYLYCGHHLNARYALGVWRFDVSGKCSFPSVNLCTCLNIYLQLFVWSFCYLFAVYLMTMSIF